jgi:hypothetical protein
MKKNLIPFLLSTLVIGCSSTPTTQDPERFTTLIGGQSAGDATSFYWYTEQLDAPYSAADYVTSGDYGWYESDYVWRERAVRELVRNGLRRQESGEMAPFKIHLRFNKDGEAVYQQYRLDGKVLPLTTLQIDSLLNEAQSIQTVTQSQAKSGARLIQGYWDGELFTTCDGREFNNVEFNQSLPSFVVNRLASLDSYVAFVGSSLVNKLVVNNLLMLEEDSFDCIERPVLIEAE